MEIGMAAKDDVEHLREGDQRIVDLALQAVHRREQAKEDEVSGKVRVGMKKDTKVVRMQIREEGTHGRGVGKKGSKGQEKCRKGAIRDLEDFSIQRQTRGFH